MAKRRTRGDGSLHLRKDGRWEGRYVVGYDDKGLPMTKNVLAKTKAECAAKLAQLRDTLKEPAPDQPKPGILLTDWLDLWYQGYKKPNLRPNTPPLTPACGCPYLEPPVAYYTFWQVRSVPKRTMLLQ